jgi:hypothetical protein
MTRIAVASTALAMVFNAAHGQQPCTSIQFKPGTSSVNIQGTAPTDEPFACYTLATGKGQTATIRITKPDGVAFNVAGLVDNRDNYSFKTEVKTYRIDVYTMGRGPTPFTMLVSVR